jgi:hypothetical protein
VEELVAAKSRRVSKLEKIREAAVIVVADILIDRLVGSEVYL